MRLQCVYQSEYAQRPEGINRADRAVQETSVDDFSQDDGVKDYFQDPAEEGIDQKKQANLIISLSSSR